MTSFIRLRAALPALALAAGALGGCIGDQVTDPVSDGLRATGQDASKAPAKPRTRTYYIAADVVDWDYVAPGVGASPGTRDSISGLLFTEHPHAGTFVLPGPERIGSKYRKILYREYTDATFSTLRMDVDPEYRARWEHLGTLGPTIQAQVGDTIEVVFRNHAEQHVSVHPHGVFYDKDSEGAPYCDGGPRDPDSGQCIGGVDDAVPPGETVVYTWPVPDRAGPGPADGTSIMWMYHSHTDEVKDTNAGLIGTIIVVKRGKITESGQPINVDREFVVLFVVFDENESWLLGANIDAFAGDAGSVDPDDDEFVESNLMHAINGWVYGYQPLRSMTMRQGERVRWYVMGMGTEVDLHTPHWHGQTGLVGGMRTDIVELLPASMKVFDMEPDNPGIWLFHCHVNDHINAGMLTRFVVE
ncbi:MAG TPA: multicopper oxidase domain-containing protein [Gemmatimonadaceae bacterium]